MKGIFITPAIWAWENTVKTLNYKRINEIINNACSIGETYIILGIGIDPELEEYIKSQGYNVSIHSSLVNSALSHTTVISWDLYKEKEVLS